jgi:hypothetical protein
LDFEIRLKEIEEIYPENYGRNHKLSCQLKSVLLKGVKRK